MLLLLLLPRVRMNNKLIESSALPSFNKGEEATTPTYPKTLDESVLYA